MDAESKTASTSIARDDGWIRLVQKKDFSRLLYPNPVCFLCTPALPSSSSSDDYQANVMTITWLTATDNEGRFVMSLNKRRHTANYMQTVGREFCLCVPVAGMEPLVVAVGSTSGSFGTKFAGEARTSSRHKEDERKMEVDLLDGEDPSSEATKQLSKHQKKRLAKEAKRRQIIPDHIQIAFGGQPQSETTDGAHGGPFCMDGTVAHLRCTSYKVDNREDQAIEDGHYLISGEIIDAYCKSGYWDEKERIFCPKAGHKPFLTFFGSGAFGHVVSGRGSY